MLRDLAPAAGGPSGRIDRGTHGGAGRRILLPRLARAASPSRSMRRSRLPRSRERRSARQPCMSLLDACRGCGEEDPLSALVFAPSLGGALRLAADAGVARAARRCERCPSACTTGSWRCMFLSGVGVALRGPVDDTMLLSYALNPTHATQSLADVAARHGQPPPSTLPAAAAAIHALAPALREEADKAGVSRVYTEIDLPLAPVLFRMEQAGVRIDTRRAGRAFKAICRGDGTRGRAHLRAGRTSDSTSIRPSSLA